ncbi:MAG: 8-amino-7-oxononanoate synthase [Gammaproteobacteria bacterium]|nr:8-amino-7-oxononanoate synthase [Gammaproteobacteria bacterium]
MHALIKKRLHAHRLKHLFRERKIRPQGLCFSSNDYLGLAQDPQMIAAFCEGAYRHGIGSTGSALVSGYSKPHRTLESAFADHVGRDRALLFSNGYMANAAILQALLGKQDIAFQDKLNHASLLDGTKLSGAQLKRYRHLDAAHLNELLEAHDSENKVIISDHVFSMGGDLAPIPALIQCAHQHAATLIIDDAHGFGVVDFPYSQSEVPILVCPLGKAFGGSGALVAGSHDLIEALVQFSRPYLFSTALSPALAHALHCALKLIQTEPWRREKLHTNIAYFKQLSTKMGLPFTPSITGIQMLPIGDNEKAEAISQSLIKRRLFVRAIRPPSVPEAALRITLSSRHEAPEIAFLLREIEALL